MPRIAVPTERHSGALPPRASFFRVDEENGAITAVKAAENGEGLVRRLVECEGTATKATLRSHWFLRNGFETDLLERGGKELPSDGEVVRLSLRPHEIKTVLLKNWGYAPLR